MVAPFVARAIGGYKFQGRSKPADLFISFLDRVDLHWIIIVGPAEAPEQGITQLRQKKAGADQIAVFAPTIVGSGIVTTRRDDRIFRAAQHIDAWPETGWIGNAFGRAEIAVLAPAARFGDDGRLQRSELGFKFCDRFPTGVSWINIQDNKIGEAAMQPDICSA